MRGAHQLGDVWPAEVLGAGDERHPGRGVGPNVVLCHRIHQPHRLQTCSTAHILGDLISTCQATHASRRLNPQRKFIL